MNVNKIFHDFSVNFTDSGELFLPLQIQNVSTDAYHRSGVMAMKKPSYLRWILSVETVGILSAILSRNGTQVYGETILKPALSPPAVLFPVVWTILYALMGIGAARIAAAPDSRARSLALNVFVMQLIVNFFWSLIFFNAQAFGFAFFWLLLLWVLIGGMLFLFYRVDKAAALLQIPYFLWVTFAAYLNYGVWQLNK